MPATVLNIFILSILQLCRASSSIPKYRWRNSDSEMLKNLFNVKQLVRAKMRGTLRYYSLFNILNYEIIELKLFRGIYLVWLKNILKNWEEIRSLWPILSHSVTRFRSITYSHPSLHGKILLIFPSSAEWLIFHSWNQEDTPASLQSHRNCIGPHVIISQMGMMHYMSTPFSFLIRYSFPQDDICLI